MDTQLPDRPTHGAHIAGMAKGQTVDPRGNRHLAPVIPQPGQPLPEGVCLFQRNHGMQVSLGSTVLQ